MDGSGFDRFARRLATRADRRKVMHGLIGGAAAVVAMQRGTSLAAPQSKVTICHWNGSSYNQITVSQNAVGAHKAHQHGLDIINPDFASDVTCGDCDVSCTDDTTCIEGACLPIDTGCVPNCDGQQCGDDGCGGTCTCLERFTCLSNGTCAWACTHANDCVDVGGCDCTAEAGSSNSFCFDGTNNQPCSSNSDCNAGTFCDAATCVNACLG